MEMYATRKGWDIGGVEVACEYTPPSAGARPASGSSCASPTPHRRAGRAPARHRRQVPVHRTLDGEVADERVERVTLAH
jgi:putative redox protein